MRSNQITQILETIDPGPPVVKLVNNGGHSIAISAPYWNPELASQLLEDTYINSLIKRNIRREMKTDGLNKGYYVDRSGTLSNIKNEVCDTFLSMAQYIIEAKEPRRTSLWKSCKEIRKKAHRADFNDELFTTLFDLSDYYYSVTKENGDIRSTENVVHRKNMLYILKSMEQKYGKQNNIK